MVVKKSAGRISIKNFNVLLIDIDHSFLFDSSFSDIMFSGEQILERSWIDKRQ
jgi:hypothetical protein